MLKVDTIEMGTVIDHIMAGKGYKVMKLLGVEENYPNRVALVTNVPSKRMGKKDIVKIEGKTVDERTVNMIALLSPGASVNLIKNEKVEKKYLVELPRELKGAGTCPNPDCITNSEYCEMRFRKEDSKYRCSYCERVFSPDELI
jgi:aspartate carbamoyltransferase regulatory subunit